MHDGRPVDRGRPARRSGSAAATASRSSPNNAVEWLLADFGILYAGGVVVPMFATTADDQVAYILTDSEAKAVFVGRRRRRRAPAPCRPPRSAGRRAARGEGGFERSSQRCGRRHPRDEATLRACREGIARGRSGGADLHVGHDGTAQGRDALARQPALRRAQRVRRADQRPARRGDRAVGAAVRAHLRAHRRARLPQQSPLAVRHHARAAARRHARDPAARTSRSCRASSSASSPASSATRAPPAGCRRSSCRGRSRSARSTSARNATAA